MADSTNDGRQRSQRCVLRERLAGRISTFDEQYQSASELLRVAHAS